MYYMGIIHNNKTVKKIVVSNAHIGSFLKTKSNTKVERQIKYVCQFIKEANPN